MLEAKGPKIFPLDSGPRPTSGDSDFRPIQKPDRVLQAQAPDSPQHPIDPRFKLGPMDKGSWPTFTDLINWSSPNPMDPRAKTVHLLTHILGQPAQGFQQLVYHSSCQVASLEYLEYFIGIMERQKSKGRNRSEMVFSGNTNLQRLNKFIPLPMYKHPCKVTGSKTIREM